MARAPKPPHDAPPSPETQVQGKRSRKRTTPTQPDANAKGQLLLSAPGVAGDAPGKNPRVKPKAGPKETKKRKSRAKPKSEHKKNGRPRGVSGYPDDAWDEVLDRLETGRETLVDICADPRLPARRTVLDRTDVDPAFSARYARARRLWEEALQDDMFVTSRTPDVQEVVTESIKEVAGVRTIMKVVHRADAIDSRRLRVLAADTLLRRMDNQGLRREMERLRAREDDRKERRITAIENTADAIRARANALAANGGVRPQVELVVTNIVTREDEYGDLDFDSAQDDIFEAEMEELAATITAPTPDEAE